MKIVSQSLINKASEEVRQALQDMEKAEEERREVVKQYIHSEPVREGEKIPSPPKPLTVDGVTEIMKAGEKCDAVKNKFEESLRRYKQLI